MHPWRPRILMAVPQHADVRFEIVKAIHKLATEIDKDNEVCKRAQRAEAERAQIELSRSCDEAVEALRAMHRELRKYGYDPNEPRVPAGNREGGQWTKGDWGVGSNAAGAVLSDTGPDNNWRPGAQYAANEPPPGIGHNQGPPLDDPPRIPSRVPFRARLINDFLKATAYWLATAIPDHPKVRRFRDALRATRWLVDNYLPYITSYFDPPKSWDELQQNALSQRPGYDIHHPIEQKAAQDAGFTDSVVDGPGNRLSVPTLKHWQITGWYMTRNRDFGGVSPRNYLRDKDWYERLRVGKMALIRFGVLKP